MKHRNAWFITVTLSEVNSTKIFFTHPISSAKQKTHTDRCAFLEVPARFELANNGFADRGLTTWLRYHLIKTGTVSPLGYIPEYNGCWSGRRGSNSLPPPWQGGALPDELHPHLWCLRSESNQRHVDFQSTALPTELQRHIVESIALHRCIIWRPRTDSNRRPPA